MAGSSPQQDVFDLRKIRRLVELMKEHDLSEIDLRQGETRVQLRRGGKSAAPAAPVAKAPPAAERSQVEGTSAADGIDQLGRAEHIVLIRSPMVGTFYAAADPDSPPYAKVGDHVGVETTVCIVEAMKVFNQIPAEVSGKIVSVLVENGEPIEFGQPLFKVDTRQ